MKATFSNWHVITGSPSAGKTTLLNAIAHRGYKVIPEAARTLIDLGISKGMNLKEIRNSELEFQETVLKIKIQTERDLDSSETIFFDRGILDSIAFLKFAGAPAGQIGSIKCEKRYKNIFYLESLPYENDYARIESFNTSKQIGKLIQETYLDHGYDIINVPIMTVSDRLDFVFTRLNHKQ